MNNIGQFIFTQAEFTTLWGYDPTPSWSAELWDSLKAKTRRAYFKHLTTHDRDDYLLPHTHKIVTSGRKTEQLLDVEEENIRFLLQGDEAFFVESHCYDSDRRGFLGLPRQMQFRLGVANDLETPKPSDNRCAFTVARHFNQLVTKGAVSEEATPIVVKECVSMFLDYAQKGYVGVTIYAHELGLNCPATKAQAAATLKVLARAVTGIFEGEAFHSEILRQELMWEAKLEILGASIDPDPPPSYAHT